jgi:PmbA protein
VTDPDLLELARRIVDQARSGEQIETYVARGVTTSVKAYEGEVESLTSAQSQGVGIRVIRDHRQGFAHCGTLDADVVAETLADARDNTTFGEPDEWFGLAEPDGVAPPQLELGAPAVDSFATEKKVELALAIERAVKGIDPRVTGVRVASYGDSTGEYAVATSTGIVSTSADAGCHVSVSALATDGDETKIGGSIDAGRDPEQLDLDQVAREAVERTVQMFGATKPPSTRLAIVLEPRYAATVLGIVAGMLSGERVLKGRSPFADRMGDEIASPLLELGDDPTDPRSLAADRYDGEGLATRPNLLIEAGRLRGFLQNSYTGRRSGGHSTGSAVRGYRSTPGVGMQAMVVAPGAGTLDELIAGIDHGFLVCGLTGLHSGVNAVSGDFSVGAEGLMIRNGAVAEPVREVTIASTLPRMLLDIRAVGADVESLPSGSTAPSLVIADVTLGGA